MVLKPHSTRVALGSHAAHRVHWDPVPKYWTLHAQVTLSKRVWASHTPKVSALTSQRVQTEQVSFLKTMTPAYPVPHWQLEAPSEEEL